MDPTGAPADDVEIFRSFIRHRVAEDLTLDPQMFRRILKLAELGLEHEKSIKRAEGAHERAFARRVRNLQRRYNVPEARIRRLIRAMSRDSRYRSPAALAKRLQRIRNKWTII